jgi:hypothetical protein
LTCIFLKIHVFERRIGRLSLEALQNRRGEALWLPGQADEYDLDADAAEQRFAAPDLLRQQQMRTPGIGALRDDLQHLVDSCRTQIVDFQPPHDESRRDGGLALGDKIGMMNAEEAKEIRPAPFAPAQIARVINEAGEVGVLELDAHWQDMATILDPPRKVRPVLISLPGHRPPADC